MSIYEFKVRAYGAYDSGNTKYPDYEEGNCYGCSSGQTSSLVPSALNNQINQKVRLPVSLYVSNISSYAGSRQIVKVDTSVLPWNQSSDRLKRSVSKTIVPSHGNSLKSSLTRLRPGALKPGGKGVDIKHNSYDRYLNKLKGKTLNKQSNGCCKSNVVTEFIPNVVDGLTQGGLQFYNIYGYNYYFNDEVGIFGYLSIVQPSLTTQINNFNYSETESPDKNSAISWGYIYMDSDADVQFKLDSDDSSWLFLIDAVLYPSQFSFPTTDANKLKNTSLYQYAVIDNSGTHTSRTVESNVLSLQEQKIYTLIVLYGNDTNDSGLTFSWKYADGNYSTDLGGESSIFYYLQ